MISFYFPSFLSWSLAAWGILLVVFFVVLRSTGKMPDDRILDYKAKTIEVKEKLGIKIYKF